MDDTTRNAERTYWADPTFENYRRWFSKAKRAGHPMPLDAARQFDFSVVADNLSDFTIHDVALAELYGRTQLVASNILSAAEQRLSPWYKSRTDYPPIERRWFWCPAVSCFIYYFVIDKGQWGISNDTSIILTAKIPYEIANNEFKFPFEKCNYCDRQAFLVELTEDNLGITALLDCFSTDEPLLDCFSTDDPKHPFIIEDEHDVTFADFSGGHQFNLLERLERLQGMDIHVISPPPSSIELPISGAS